MELKQLVSAHLEHARERTLGLLAPFDDEALCRQVSPLMSPLVWDLAHIGHYEELWLLRAVADARPTDERFDDLYDAFQHPRAERVDLPILGPSAARAYLADVRERVLDTLQRVELDSQPLLDRAFVYGMVIQHEHMHCETMLATIQLMETPYALPSDTSPAATSGSWEAEELSLPGGAFVMGTDTEAWAFDNERPAHEVEVAPFRIDLAPVTNAEFIEFIADGGYDDVRLWADAGWKWRQDVVAEHPLFWQSEGDGQWSRLRFGRQEDVPATEPVQHVCWYEADAFARWAGKRLPTEPEWEYAASWDHDGRKRRYPWGDLDPTPAYANLGQLRLGPTPVDTFPVGTSAWGCLDMAGNVWEWTASDFRGYPGFTSFPYREYSEVFFGNEYKVLRGGSWAVHPVACRTTFRNWDFPIRRQIFAGFRCARDES